MRTDPERENILSIRDDDKHTKYRAKLAPRYTGKDVEHLEPRIDRNTLDLVNLPDKTYITKAQYFTLDIISVTGLRPQSGSGLGAQTTAPMEAGLRLYSCAPRSSCIYS